MRSMSLPFSQGVSAMPKKYKLVLLGESGVGKSSIALRFSRNEWTGNIQNTIGAAFFRVTISIESRELERKAVVREVKSTSSENRIDSDTFKENKDEIPVAFEIWDTAGQERFRSLASMYYRGAAAALLVYDITNSDSLEKARFWKRELAANSPNTLLALVGNKADLLEEPGSSSGGGELAEELGISIHGEVSAKTGEGVAEIFRRLAVELLKKSEDNFATAEGEGAKVIHPSGDALKSNKPINSKETCSC